MPPRIRLFPECHADTALIRFLVKNEDLLRHSAGLNEVAKDMQAVSNDFDKVLGIVDNDKHKPRYFNSFVQISEANKTYFLQKPDSNEYLVIIDKAIETFLLWNATQVDIDLTAYGFTTDVKRFGFMLKRRDVETDVNYIRLLSDLYFHQAPGFTTLEQILNDFLTP